MQITLRNIQYHPNGSAVALLMEGPTGADKRPLWSFFLNTTQAALEARAAGAVWSDGEALDEAQALLDAQYPGQGFVAALPAPPTPPEVSDGD